MEYNKAFRFFYVGKKERDYVNGLDIIEKKYKRLQNEESELKESEKEHKLPEIVICSGERDAMNVAGLGYLPIWLNSETAQLDEPLMARLLSMAKRVYNIPDIDSTGLRAASQLALRHLDIYTVELPAWLRTYRDNRGRARKDLRDFLELRPYRGEFHKLLHTASPCKFWVDSVDKNGNPKVEIKITAMLHYLKMNGFYKFRDPISNSTRYVRVDGYKVREYEPKEIRDFVKSDLKKRQISTYILDVFLNSKRTSSTFADDLDAIEIDFKKSTHESRTLFFDNVAATVYADRIDITANNEIKQYVWEENVSPHTFKRIDPAFSFTLENENQSINFETRHTQSHLFAMTINASRMYWREEFEQRATGNADEDTRYKNEYKFSILSPRLTDRENDEQLLHLMNKIYAIGYQLHRYKMRSKALALWILENKLTGENESSGGSGKSMFSTATKMLKLLNVTTLDGRNKKLTENSHLLDRVTSNCDMLFIDDAHRYFNFDSFYSMITGGMTVNLKGDKSFEIDYEDSPILAVSSNFPMQNDDKSTMRRLLTVVFSDYYHFNNGDGTYNESRSIADDFGKDIFGHDYTDTEYNADLNFCVDCLQFYLTMLKHNIVLQAPMENVHKRMNIAKMGDLFAEWAEVYFAAESGHLDTLVEKQTAWVNFLRETGASDKQWKITRFTKALRAFAENAENIECLNPTIITGYDCNNKRILRRRGGKLTEYIYLKTINTPINNESFAEPLI